MSEAELTSEEKKKKRQRENMKKWLLKPENLAKVRAKSREWKLAHPGYEKERCKANRSAICESRKKKYNANRLKISEKRKQKIKEQKQFEEDMKRLSESLQEPSLPDLSIMSNASGYSGQMNEEQDDILDEDLQILSEILGQPMPIHQEEQPEQDEFLDLNIDLDLDLDSLHKDNNSVLTKRKLGGFARKTRKRRMRK